MPVPRRFQRLNWRRILIVLSLAWFFLDVLRYHSLRLSNTTRPTTVTAASPEIRIFIASTHWNNEQILRDFWNDAVIQLVKHFGPNNTFVSVYESGSWDDSKGALRELQTGLEELNTRHKIVLDTTTHEDEIAKSPSSTGWIDTPRGRRELRGIPYLSRLRNLSLEPLHALAREGIFFDKILFLNDVVFTLEDVRQLLSTNNGHYAAACSIDYSKPPHFYDTFALRDSEGHEAIMSTWPYFRSHTSRRATKNANPVPVSSCWNGMVFMDATPFYSHQHSLRFRGITDSLALSHLEASECCLIHRDNPLSRTHGVFINPRVRVGYNKAAYDAVHAHDHPVTLVAYMHGTWKNRILRWTTSDWFKRREVRRRLSRWQSLDSTRREPGVDCLVNEMQVLAANGWAHV